MSMPVVQPEEKETQPKAAAFKVGQKVKVIDVGCAYNAYAEMAEQMDLTSFEPGRKMEGSINAKVVATAPHPGLSDKTRNDLQKVLALQLMSMGVPPQLITKELLDQGCEEVLPDVTGSTLYGIETDDGSQFVISEKGLRSAHLSVVKG